MQYVDGMDVLCYNLRNKSMEVTNEAKCICYSR